MRLLPEAIWLAIEPVDMRTGADGLSLHVQQVLGRTRCDGTTYVFSKRRRTRLKLVCWDGHRRMDVLATSASRTVRLAAGGRYVLANECRAMALACRRRGLAAAVGNGAGLVALMTT